MFARHAVTLIRVIFAIISIPRSLVQLILNGIKSLNFIIKITI